MCCESLKKYNLYSRKLYRLLQDRVKVVHVSVRQRNTIFASDGCACWWEVKVQEGWAQHLSKPARGGYWCWLLVLVLLASEEEAGVNLIRSRQTASHPQQNLAE
jgi:hypothetical protein